MRFGALPDRGGVTATAAHICPCVVSCADACAAAAVNKAKASSEDFISIPLLAVVAAQVAPKPHVTSQNTSLRLTCNCRMLMLELRLVIVPKPPLPGIGTPLASRWSADKLLFGLPKLG